MVAEQDGDVGMVSTREELAQALTYVRLHAGLSIRQLAARLDMPPATIGDYFSGRHLPGPSRIATFQQLLAECGIDDDPTVQRWLKTVAQVKAASDGRVSRWQKRPAEPVEPDGAAAEPTAAGAAGDGWSGRAEAALPTVQ